ncbi:MAG: hydrogenase maturation protease [Spirochaetaceae bacterium]|nr:MAG: hydrogenase maturation protease [Spirochaetaceae bacterium]
MIEVNVFQKILKGKVVIVGVGNTLRGDDGLGPAFVEQLQDKVDVPCINAGNALENHLGPIIRERPDTVLLVDAVHLNLDPGDARIVDPSRIVHAGLSTHDVSAGLFLDFLVEETGCTVFLLGVQPEQIELGSGISDTIEKTLGALEQEIIDALRGREYSSTDKPGSESIAAFGLQ